MVHAIFVSEIQLRFLLDYGRPRKVGNAPSVSMSSFYMLNWEKSLKWASRRATKLPTRGSSHWSNVMAERHLIIYFPIYGFLYNSWDHNFGSFFQNHMGVGVVWRNSASPHLSYVFSTVSASPGEETFVRTFHFCLLPLVVIFFVYVYVYLYYRSRCKRNVTTYLLHLKVILPSWELLSFSLEYLQIWLFLLGED